MHLIFDLDGVLVDFAGLHRSAFLEAWNSIYPDKHIDEVFHAIYLEARSTRQKLAIMKDHFENVDEHRVSELKQKITQEKLQTAHVYSSTRNALNYLKSKGMRMSVCSNSIRSTVLKSLEKLAPLDYFDVILSNEDVINPKPHPEIYETAIKMLKIDPTTATVFEDSAVGKAAARAAGLKVIEIVDALDLTPRFIELVLNDRMMTTYHYNVVIPMAGLGSRFAVAGYSTPKPFLPIFGTPMYLKVIENVVPSALRNCATVHIIVREEHRAMFDAAEKPANIRIHTVPALTEGAACTVLSVKSEINNADPLIIANSDQYLEWDVENFYRTLIHPDYDGVISTFHQPDSTDLRWSYTNVNEDGAVMQVAEKKHIGPLATTGIYGWKQGADFVADAEAMIAADIRVNKEFYVCPVYNTGITAGRQFRTLNCKKMWGLGVPADYEHFLAHFNPTP
jgi:HAD superfamily hydrolase (TIGR01509 family)